MNSLKIYTIVTYIAIDLRFTLVFLPCQLVSRGSGMLSFTLRCCGLKLKPSEWKAYAPLQTSRSVNLSVFLQTLTPVVSPCLVMCGVQIIQHLKPCKAYFCYHRVISQAFSVNTHDYLMKLIVQPEKLFAKSEQYADSCGQVNMIYLSQH